MPLSYRKIPYNKGVFIHIDNIIRNGIIETEISFLGEFKMKNAACFFLIGLFLFGVLSTVALKVFDRPIAHVNERGKCVFLTVIENNRERAIKCPINWRDYQVSSVPSDEVLREFFQHLSEEKVHKPETKELLDSLKEEFKKRERIAQQE